MINRANKSKAISYQSWNILTDLGSGSGPSFFLICPGMVKFFQSLPDATRVQCTSSKSNKSWIGALSRSGFPYPKVVSSWLTHPRPAPLVIYARHQWAAQVAVCQPLAKADRRVRTMLARSPSVLDLQVTPKYLNYTSKVCICKEGIKLISLISKVDWIRTTLPLFLSVVLFRLLIVKGFNIFNLNWFPANLCYARQLMNCALSWNTFFPYDIGKQRSNCLPK